MRRRARRFGRLERFYLLVVTAFLVGGSWWLDERSPTVTAVVSGKREDIVVRRSPQGSWDRYYRVVVKFPEVDATGAGATLTLPRERFDAIRTGDSLSVHYMSAFPILARAADRSTWQIARELPGRVMSDRAFGVFFAWLAGGIIALWIASRVATIAVFAAGILWIVAAFPLVFPAPPVVNLPTAEATATVEAVTLVTKAPARSGYRGRRRFRSTSDFRRLAMPYQVVQLRYVVPGNSEPTIAVDAVDSASAAELEPGMTVPVRYDPAAPRDARLAIGSRRFMERNRYHLIIPVVGLAIIGTLGAWGWRARREG